MKPDEYYQKQIDHYTARLKQIKKRRNLITLAKLLTFGYMIFLIYLLINHSTQPLLLLGIGAILVFIFDSMGFPNHLPATSHRRTTSYKHVGIGLFSR